jgi:uncharacterized protein
MRFWDSSALVPLICAEESSVRCGALLVQDSRIAAWYLTPIEIYSSLARKRREGNLSDEQQQAARERLAALEEAWTEIDPSDAVRARARRLLDVHSLRTADSLQLAAALLYCEERTSDVEFVSLDDALRGAAKREGFTVLP